MQENWIGRSEGARVLFRDRRPGRADRNLHDAAGHALRRLVPRACRRTTRWPSIWRRERCRARRLHRRMQPHGHQRGGDRDRRETRLSDPARSGAPVRSEPAGPGLGRQFRADGIRHRRHLRLPGARPARPRIRPQIRAAGDPGGVAAGRRPATVRDRRRGLRRGRHHVQLGVSRRPAGGRGQARRRRAARGPGPRRAHDRLPAARLGGVAAALLGLPDPGHPLRGLRHRAGARERIAGDVADGCQLRRARQPARSPSDLEACRLPALPWPGAARNRHARHVL